MRPVVGTRAWLALLGVPVCVTLCAGGARAEPVFTGKVSLTALFYTESDGVDDPMKIATKSATNSLLAYGELRTLLEGKRLWRDRLDLRLDLRIRATGGLDFNRAFSLDPLVEPNYQKDPAMSLGTSARGYLGGPEYDLREAYGLLRINDRYTLQAGRMYVREADAIKIDGVRLLRKFGEHWEGSALFGGYPNPYSRSLLTDYEPPCGAGVSGTRTGPAGLPDAPADQKQAGGQCQTDGPQAAFAAGVTARYNYSSLWGALALVGTFYGGSGDGGPVQKETKLDPNGLNVLQPPNGSLDAPRVYVSWINSWRPIERLDLFADAVIDLYGSGGPQLTRLVTLGTLRLLRDDRLTLRLGYSHLSSLAIDMYLNRLVYNRVSGFTLGTLPSAVENNLTVLRTGRDEVRATADIKVVGKLGAYLDARFRHRNLLSGDSNAPVYDSAAYNDNTANLGGDVTVGVRDSGTIRAIRAALAYTALFNYRAQNHVLSLDLGRDFLSERLGVDLNYVLAVTTDSGADQPNDKCMADTPFLVGCFGRRSGTTHELGLTVTASPWKRLFLMLDYRFVALLTNPQKMTGATMAEDVPTILSHSLLLRGEFRW